MTSLVKSGIALMAVGLILALAVADRIEGVDLSMIGWIVAGAGALMLVFGMLSGQRKASSTTITQDSAGRATETTTESSIDAPDRPL